MNLDRLVSQETVSTKKRILILYTGGTMGMTHNESGALEPTPGYHNIMFSLTNTNFILLFLDS